MTYHPPFLVPRSVWASRMSCGVTLIILSGFLSGVLGAGDKLELSNPDKKANLPDLPESGTKKRRGDAPFEFLDRRNSTGGAMQAPSVSPSSQSPTLDPRAQRKLLDAMDREKNWSFRKDPDARALESDRSEKDREFDSENETFGNERKTLFQRAIEGEDTADDGTGDPGSAKREKRDRKRFTDATDRHRENSDTRTDGLTTEENGPRRLYRPDQQLRDEREKARNTARTGFGGDKIELDDPFAPEVRRTTGLRSFGSFTDLDSPKIPADKAGETARAQQFQRLMAGPDANGRSAESGLGTFGQPPGDRAAQFRGLLSGSTPSPSSAGISPLLPPSGRSSSFELPSAASLASPPKGRSSFQDFVPAAGAAPSSFVPFSTPAPSIPNSPFRPPPASLPVPSRLF
ncbi:MAG: hypothetical protein EXS36_14475 [Pedosphaera sp.]|nr:hypothetical protein [Pedosphaera sp.]